MVHTKAQRERGHNLGYEHGLEDLCAGQYSVGVCAETIEICENGNMACWLAHDDGDRRLELGATFKL